MKQIWFLHGFLGRLSDGDFLRKIPGVQLHLLDYFHQPELNPLNSFDDWGKNFCTYVMKANANQTVENILVGYSLGGRLAAHGFLQKPDLFSKVYLVSSHLGLDSETERKVREQSDEEWARRFEKQPWDQLMMAWFAQKVFQGQTEIFRNETDYNRQHLSAALTNWSLAKQKPLLREMASFAKKIVYVYG
jgi:2-succinyl-6-hydroxy-2,4-cyclohexadiene-1-carboxylate synthase